MNPGAMTTLVTMTVVAVALALAARGRAHATTVDFYLAGQRIGLATNASAICGDYFSAASFLGVAGAVYASGLDGVWYATGFAAGFIPVLLFVAAPLRRFGHMSIPDFLGRWFDSDRVRLVAVGAVELIILSYLIPQAVGSGLTWEILVGAGFFGLSPYATGVIVSAAAISLLVVVGGMRGTTWNQAVQFLFLLFVLLWLLALVTHTGFSYAAAVGEAGNTPLANPAPTAGGWQLQPVTNHLDPAGTARFGLPGGRYGGAGQFSLVVTLVLGTAGLPHVMNRYFTSPTGRAARTTTVWVIGMAGVFYATAVMLGTAARVLVAERASQLPWLADLTIDGVLKVPEHALLVLGRMYAGFGGLGIVAAAALAAMMSTIAGLLLAAAASWGHDVYERYLRPGASQQQALRAGRAAVVIASLLAAGVALATEPGQLVASFPSIVTTMVTWAFSLAGSSLTPVLILAIWWPRITARGAVAGMVTGLSVSLGMILLGLLRGSGTDGLASVLLAPTIVAAPAATLAIIGRSLADEAPAGVAAIWVRLHGTAVDRQIERLARLTVREGER